MAGGAPKGNKNGAKGKQFELALRKALAHDAGSASEGLLKVGKMLVKAALEGEPWAIKEIADRIDGRPAQAITNDESGEFTVNQIVRTVIESSVKHPDS